MGTNEFWGLTFGEFWPLVNSFKEEKKKVFNSNDLKNLKERWTNGTA